MELHAYVGIFLIAIVSFQPSESLSVATVAGSAHLGCYEDHRDRMLRNEKSDEKTNKKGVRRDFDHTNTPAECANFCKDYKYFGVESSQECYCGNVMYTEGYDKKDEGNCNYKCPGDKTQRCGGRWKINVYEVRSSEDYRVAADAYGECKDLDGARITSEDECKTACNSLKIKNVYQVGQWGHSPGCFYYGGNRNCHWNTRTDVSWSAGDHFAVCRHKLNNVWMTGLNGDLYLSQLSIPGTHDSVSTSEYGNFCHHENFCACQDRKIDEQLDAGIRFFDIRLRHKQDTFDIHHGAFYLNRNIDQVMADFAAFLKKNPGEVIIMSYQIAESEKDTTRSFAASLQAVLDKNKGIVYQGQRIPKLKDVRGKIVMLNFGNDGRFDQGLQWRFDWQDGAFAIQTVENVWTPGCLKRLDWNNNCDDYVKSLEDNMDAANAAKSTSLMYITYTSATIKPGSDIARPLDYARHVNPRIKDFIAGKSKPYIGGAIVMDFPNYDLIKTIISKN